MSSYHWADLVGIVRKAIDEATQRPARVCPFCHQQLCLVHCIYCGADCTDTEPDHRASCPAMTGVYPVNEHNMACCRCLEPLALTYHHVEIETDVVEVVCAGCALAAQIGDA